MIKLEKIDEREVEEYCREIYDGMSKTHREGLNSLIYDFFKDFTDCPIEFSNDEDNENFFKIMVADWDILTKLKELIDRNKNRFDDMIGSPIPNTNSVCKDYLKNKYEGMDKKRLVNLTKLTVCPYCNRNFINVTDFVNGSQLDHFYNKSSYPIFALSFYNLIPSCYSCNNKKSDNEFQVSPYDENSHREAFLKFSWQPQVVTSSPWFDAKSIEITMNIPEGNKYKSDFEKLDLQNQYQLHTDYVQELLWKKQVYSKSYKKKLKEFGGLGLTESDFERVITGVYTEEKNYGKRPLSKMVTEISKEIGLIGEDK